jgi:hypothetical protein
MTDNDAGLQAALERVVAATRGHLDAVRAAAGAPDDEAVWLAYVELNNASREYDEMLNDVFGEVTPWDLEPISASDADETFAAVDLEDIEPLADDPYPPVLSVRQRRDYRIPSVSALLRAAEAARGAAEGTAPVPRADAAARDERGGGEARPIPRADAAARDERGGGEARPITTVAEAVLELLQGGDGTLRMLEVPELEPLDGVVVVTEVEAALDPEAHDHTDGEAPFRLAGSDRTTGRLDERAAAEPGGA